MCIVQVTATNTGINSRHYTDVSNAFCWTKSYNMMTSSNGNIFRVTGHLCGEFTGDPHKGQWRGALMLSLICVWINGWVNNREASDLRHHSTHYDVIVMNFDSNSDLVWSWWSNRQSHDSPNASETTLKIMVHGLLLPTWIKFNPSKDR